MLFSVPKMDSLEESADAGIALIALTIRHCDSIMHDLHIAIQSLLQTNTQTAVTAIECV